MPSILSEEFAVVILEEFDWDVNRAIVEFRDKPLDYYKKLYEQKRKSTQKGNTITFTLQNGYNLFKFL